MADAEGQAFGLGQTQQPLELGAHGFGRRVVVQEDVALHARHPVLHRHLQRHGRAGGATVDEEQLPVPVDLTHQP